MRLLSALSPFCLTSPLLVLVLDSYAALLLSTTSTSSTIELMSAIPFEIGLDCPSTSVFFVQALVQHVLLGSKCCYFFLVIMLFLWLRDLMNYFIVWREIVLVEWVDCLFLGKLYKNLNLEWCIATWMHRNHQQRHHKEQHIHKLHQHSHHLVCSSWE